ncbi:VPA1267 family protein [Massilia sp. DWR3-1-1]|uniref:VPA1267 family protein n=1 Tax=Massilia sp. DWR3-1-1 TaxID=2804559 RepID=UPI003CF2370D
MANGQQLAAENVKAFQAWMAAKSDSDFREMVHRGVLSRKEIVKECGFALSALSQNPSIKSALRELETTLRERGVLPAAVRREEDASDAPELREKGRLKATLDADRLRRLEQENASLRVENAELKQQLNRYTMLQDALRMTGRLPR